MYLILWTRRDALRAGKIKPGDACVLRFMGLKARFGTTAFLFQDELKGYKALFESCAIITDGRYSGASAGPRWATAPGGRSWQRAAIIENGDTIEIDVAARQMNVLLSDEEIKARLDKFEFVFPAADYPPMLRLFSERRKHGKGRGMEVYMIIYGRVTRRR